MKCISNDILTAIINIGAILISINISIIIVKRGPINLFIGNSAFSIKFRFEAIAVFEDIALIQVCYIRIRALLQERINISPSLSVFAF